MSAGKWTKLFWAVLPLMVVFSRPALSQDPSDFLKRVDANGNGLIEPSEAQGRFGFMLQGMARNNPGLDLSKPIPIAKLTEAFNRARSQMSRGGGPGGSSRGGQSRDRSGRDQSSRDRSGGNDSPYSSRVTSIEPLVPGFGEEDVMIPAPGFGAEAELFNIEVTDDDRREAARAFGYYDRNKDGVVDAQEKKRSRYGADLDLYDRNKDGRITPNEMEYRYARRRIENERDKGSSTTASRGGNNDRGNTRQQASRGGFSRGGPQGPGQQPGSRWGGGGSDRGRDSESSSDRDSKRDDRESYRVAPVIERLPSGLPDWFARNDANQDGQIAMAEFSASWSESVFDDFNQFDLNQDGLITPSETLKAVERGAERGSSGSSVSRESSDDDQASSTSSSSGEGSGASSSSSSSASLPPIDKRYLAYYSKLVAKYDSNGDGALTATEWKEMAKDPSSADGDGNGRITVEEFTRWSMKK